MRRILLATFALGLFASGAAAQGEEEARHHFRIGQAHYESGAFIEAAREFEEAYRLSNRAPLLHNIYVAYRDAGDLERSADALRRYLEAVPDDENGPVLRQRLASLERLIEERGGSDPSEPPEEAEPSETAASETAATETQAPAPAGGEADEGGLSPVGFIVAGAGAALLIGGAVTGGLALASESTLVDNCGADGACPAGYDYESEVSSAQALAITTDILIPVGIAAVAAGVVLILVLREGGDQDVAMGGFCGPDGCVGSVAGMF